MHAKYWRAWDGETWGLYSVLVVVDAAIGNQINVRRVASLPMDGVGSHPGHEHSLRLTPLF